jgi:SAM-dependent methyltransferase
MCNFVSDESQGQRRMTSDNPTRDLGTLEFYDRNAESYLAARPDEVSADLMAFLPNLAAGCRILELGCGSGRDAAEMQRLGLTSTRPMALPRWRRLPAIGFSGLLGFYASMNSMR